MTSAIDISLGRGGTPAFQSQCYFVDKDDSSEADIRSLLKVVIHYKPLADGTITTTRDDSAR